LSWKFTNACSSRRRRSLTIHPVVISPGHFFYGFLDGKLPKTDAGTVALKVSGGMKGLI